MSKPLVDLIRTSLQQELRTSTISAYTALAKRYGVKRRTLQYFLNGQTNTSFRVCEAFTNMHSETIKQWTESSNEPMFIKVQNKQSQDLASKLKDVMNASKSEEKKLMQHIRIHLAQDPKSYVNLAQEYHVSNKLASSFIKGDISVSKKLLKNFLRMHPDLMAEWTPPNLQPKSIKTQHTATVKDWSAQLNTTTTQTVKSPYEGPMQKIRTYLLEDLVQNPRSCYVLAREYQVPRETIYRFLKNKYKSSYTILKAFAEKHPEVMAQWGESSLLNGAGLEKLEKEEHQ